MILSYSLHTTVRSAQSSRSGVWEACRAGLENCFDQGNLEKEFPTWKVRKRCWLVALMAHVFDTPDPAHFPLESFVCFIYILHISAAKVFLTMTHARQILAGESGFSFALSDCLSHVSRTPILVGLTCLRVLQFSRNSCNWNRAAGGIFPNRKRDNCTPWFISNIVSMYFLCRCDLHS